MGDKIVQTVQLERMPVELDVTALEADAAYFDARLTLVGNEPDTTYQKAQIKIYTALQDHLRQNLERLRGAKTVKRKAASLSVAK